MRRALTVTMTVDPDSGINIRIDGGGSVDIGDCAAEDGPVTLCVKERRNDESLPARTLVDIAMRRAGGVPITITAALWPDAEEEASSEPEAPSA